MSVAGSPVTLTPDGRAIVRGDVGALRRLFAGLIENAVRYWRLGDARRPPKGGARAAVTLPLA